MDNLEETKGEKIQFRSNINSEDFISTNINNVKFKSTQDNRSTDNNWKKSC